MWEWWRTLEEGGQAQALERGALGGTGGGGVGFLSRTGMAPEGKEGLRGRTRAPGLRVGIDMPPE